MLAHRSPLHKVLEEVMEIRYGSDMTGHGDSLASKLEEYDNLTGIIERLDEHSVRHGGQGEIYRAKLEASRATTRVIQKLRLAACSERNPGADDGSDSGVYLVAVKVLREFAEMDMESQNRVCGLLKKKINLNYTKLFYPSQLLSLSLINVHVKRSHTD